MRKFYRWFERTEEGRLIDPLDWRGDPLLGLGKYDMYQTVHAAEEALERGIKAEIECGRKYYARPKDWSPGFDLVLIACYTSDP